MEENKVNNKPNHHSLTLLPEVENIINERLVTEKSIIEKENKSSVCEILTAFQGETSKDVCVFNHIAIIQSLLNQDECRKIIESLEKMGMRPLLSPYPLRKTSRIVIDSPELAQNVWKKVEPYIPVREIRDDFGDLWKICGINESFRFFSYGVGDFSKPHYDGFVQPSYRIKSFATLLLYLNDVDEQKGGSTKFTESGLKIRPKLGNALFFITENVLHESEEIKGEKNGKFQAEKYVMCMAVMYECKKFRNSDLRKKIYDLRQKAFSYQEEGKDTKAVEVWEKIIQIERELVNSQNQNQLSLLPSPSIQNNTKMEKESE
jgi:hypothetical protein